MEGIERPRPNRRGAPCAFGHDPHSRRGRPGGDPPGLSGLVQAKIETGKTEEAFNLAERLSELDRVQRLASFVIGEIPERERTLYRESYPRIIRIQQLNKDTASAKGEEREYLNADWTRRPISCRKKIGKATRAHSVS